jgi:transposase, IS5 family
LKRLETIGRVYEQQKAHFDQPESKIEHRIVPIQQPHIRPIVRGKEVKKVDFEISMKELVLSIPVPFTKN